MCAILVFSVILKGISIRIDNIFFVLIAWAFLKGAAMKICNETSWHKLQRLRPSFMKRT